MAKHYSQDDDPSGLLYASLDGSWYAAGCPEYRVHPAMISAMRATSIDIEARYLRFPHHVFTISLPAGRDFEVREAPDKPVIHGLLVSSFEEAEARPDDPVFISKQGIRYTKVLDNSRPQIRKLLISVSYHNGKEWEYSVLKCPLHDDKTIEDLFTSMAVGPNASIGYWPSIGFRQDIAALTVGVCFFAIGKTKVIEEAHLPRQQRRELERSGEPRFIFDVGRTIEIPRPLYDSKVYDTTENEPTGRHLNYSHIRSGHLRWQKKGGKGSKGRYDLIFVAPTVVRPDLPMKTSSPHVVISTDKPVVETNITQLGDGA
jgi:hypothetical protein